MARKVHYMTNEAYNIGYDDGWKDAVEEIYDKLNTLIFRSTKACCIDGSFIVDKLKLKEAMEDKE